MSGELMEVTSNGTVMAKMGSNSRTPYDHQISAMKNMDIINQLPAYSTLVVLPTGGGKTYTASTWLLRHAINNNKKILWIAHRQMLLDQAAESFQKFAYSENMPNISSFTYRVISGSPNHDRTIDIKPSDDLIIASKDSIGRNLQSLDPWLKGLDEVFLVIDEAHHSTAKTYRKIIEYVKNAVKNTKIIGLTATPFRTAESEKGLLAKIFTDGVVDGRAITNDIGITYKIGLKELINRGILAKPTFIPRETEEDYGANIGLADLDKIMNLDILPESIATEMAESTPRNKLIIDTYVKNKDLYGQTIVFAIKQLHAIQLAKMFNNAGVAADYIISDVNDMTTGVTLSREENERKLERFRNGELQVLVNVNILTEGVDLPKTQTVFLTRPTVSTILMTQMVGRALRGVAAGGTPDANIVSFVDSWKNIAWASPESIYDEDENYFNDNPTERLQHELRMISISKIEEFASILDSSIDTSALEKIPFVKRIPIGMYAFSLLTESNMDISYQVMVYDSTAEAYQSLMDSLEQIFADYEINDEEDLSEEILSDMAEQCRTLFFLGEMIPPYEKKDIIWILKYYAQKEVAPTFYTFDDIDRNKLDVSAIAKTICDEDMGPRRRAEYLSELWESADSNIMKTLFGRKVYFFNNVDNEVNRLTRDDFYEEEENVRYGKKELAEMSLHEIGRINPDYEKELKDTAYEQARDAKGNYVCAICGKKNKTRIPFQVDHIIPMNRGGKSVPENLQILCRSCNAKKGDH